MRRVLTGIFRRVLHVFFRRIETEGAEKVPRAGPVLFVGNHPNALVDPLLLLCFAPRPVAFLAKAPLFRMFLVGSFVRAFESIPVYRRQDSADDVVRNRETFDAAARLLARGGAIGLFPEGVSHDEPKLMPLKTGAARIALEAAARGTAPAIVPFGIYYTRKGAFRSSALVLFGDALAVASVPADAAGEPPRESVLALTDRVAESLSALTLQGETREALDVIRKAERILSADAIPLAEELDRRRRFVEGARVLALRDPARLAALESKVARFEAERRAAGLSLTDLAPKSLGAGALLRLAGRNLGALLLLPIAVLGAIVHFPAYRLTGFLARRFAGEPDLRATGKVVASILLYPATWALAAIAAFRVGGVGASVAALVILPVSAWAALAFAEALDAVLGRARSLGWLVFRGSALRRLMARRSAIRRSILEVEKEVSRPAP